MPAFHTRYVRGMARAATGETAAAIADFRRIIAVPRADSGIFLPFAQLGLARAAAKGGDPRRAKGVSGSAGPVEGRGRGFTCSQGRARGIRGNQIGRWPVVGVPRNFARGSLARHTQAEAWAYVYESDSETLAHANRDPQSPIPNPQVMAHRGTKLGLESNGGQSTFLLRPSFLSFVLRQRSPLTMLRSERSRE